MSPSYIAGADAPIRCGNWNNVAANTSTTLSGTNTVYNDGVTLGGSFQATQTSSQAAGAPLPSESDLLSAGRELCS